MSGKDKGMSTESKKPYIPFSSFVYRANWMFIMFSGYAMARQHDTTNNDIVKDFLKLIDFEDCKGSRSIYHYFWRFKKDFENIKADSRRLRRIPAKDNNKQEIENSKEALAMLLGDDHDLVKTVINI